MFQFKGPVGGGQGVHNFWVSCQEFIVNPPKTGDELFTASLGRSIVSHVQCKHIARKSITVELLFLWLAH